jgi:phage shock protein C, pspC
VLYFTLQERRKETFFVKKRLYRSKTDKKLCGVCAGVADYFGIDPTIVRVIWALLAFFYGTSILLYVIMALVVPEQPAGGGVIDVDSEVREPSEKKEKYKGPEID